MSTTNDSKKTVAVVIVPGISMLDLVGTFSMLMELTMRGKIVIGLTFQPFDVYGGGFGGKGSSLQGLQAARLARIAGAPVQVFWTREDEFFWDTYRPAAIVKIRSGLTRENKPAFWDYRVYLAGARGSAQPYDIPHHRTMAHGSRWTGPPGSHPFATGAWRAPAANTNAFAREQHIDTMAAYAGIDPLEFRLQNCSDPKYLGVLRAAAEKFAWTPAAGPSGRGFGVACGIDQMAASAATQTVRRPRIDFRTGIVSPFGRSSNRAERTPG